MVNHRVDASHGEIVACAPSSSRSVTPRRDVPASVGVTKYGGRIPTPEYREIYTLAGPPRGFKGRVVSSRQLTPTTRAIDVEKPKAFVLRPIQFTLLQQKT